ncbi:MAG: hypothetical protein ACLGJC_07665 [Alphaproteobacteria bacterium]
MANISVVNLTSGKMKLKSMIINGTSISVGQYEIARLQTVELDYRDKDWQSFSDFIMEVETNGLTYKVDLNKDHYFGGGQYRYPGSGSKVRYILSGLSEDKKAIQINYAYNSPDLDRYKYSSDLKYLKTA